MMGIARYTESVVGEFFGPGVAKRRGKEEMGNELSRVVPDVRFKDPTKSSS